MTVTMQCVLLCFIEQILGNRYILGLHRERAKFPGRHTHDPRSLTSLLTLSPLETWVCVWILTLHLNYFAVYSHPLCCQVSLRADLQLLR